MSMRSQRYHDRDYARMLYEERADEYAIAEMEEREISAARPEPEPDPLVVAIENAIVEKQLEEYRAAMPKYHED